MTTLFANSTAAGVGLHVCNEFFNSNQFTNNTILLMKR